MREILFRGKTKQGEWVYWNEYGELVGIGGKKRTRYAYHSTINSISYYHTVQQLKDSNILIKETVGQFMGLTDKNGKKIFEGDIVKVWWKGNVIATGDIKYEEKNCRFVLTEDFMYPYCFDDSTPLEVIGNIHDNPELLEEV